MSSPRTCWRCRLRTRFIAARFLSYLYITGRTTSSHAHVARCARHGVVPGITNRVLLRVVLALDSERQSGFEIAQAARLRTGTVYPAIIRLVQEGWLSEEQDDGRWYYRMTDHGRDEIIKLAHTRVGPGQWA